ncbi:unnamed protein product [Spirodela intermedia]|uniref:Cytochrome c domain-containing protein n=1 Tax=Spirodela intermedia TaxID=51605 RepID=A0A7I8IQ51_SPIIN|nr:unnamed protein product [Spirodela intermedia]CAA6659921.1 unnamed protein product [Spirodela intermedia]
MSRLSRVHLFKNAAPMLSAATKTWRRSSPLLLADRCASMRQLKQVHAQMVVRGRIHDNYASSRLISFAALSPSGDCNPTPSCGTLIRALAEARRRPAVDLYVKMQAWVRPGRHTFPFLLKGCINCHSLSTAGRSIPRRRSAVSGRVRPSTPDPLLRSGGQMRSEEAVRRSAPTGTSSSGRRWSAPTHGGGGPEPSGATLSAVLRRPRVHGEKGVAVGVVLGTEHRDVERDDLRPGEARARRRGVAAVPGAGGGGDGGAERRDLRGGPVRLLPRRAARGRPGDLPVHAEGLRRGAKLEHCGCMVDLLGRSGRLAEAEDLISTMKWEADVVVLGALLAACQRHGNVDVAERVVRRILDLEPHNHGVYVVLSNMYAEAGIWEQVELMRKTMVGRAEKGPCVELRR